MKSAILSVFFILALSTAHAEIKRWTITGEINYRNALLADTFTVGDPFTITMDVDTAASVNVIDNYYYYSTANLDSPVSNGTLDFDYYTASFAQGANGSSNLVNARSDATSSNYDQLNFSFATYDNSLSGPNVDTYEVDSLNLSFTDDTQTFDMLSGTGAFFPDTDTFHWTDSTNAAYQVRFAFTGGSPSGTNFVRGTVTNLTITPIPEPTTTATLLTLGALALAMWKRR